MPSSATTGVNISTILDLIGPSAQSASADKDQPPFDSLLQPLKSPPAAPPSPPAADDRRAERQDNNDSHRPPPSAATSDERRDDLPQDASNPRSDANSDNVAPSPSDQASSDTEDPAEQNEVQDSETVIAEALAALATIAPVAEFTAPDANAATVGQINEQESVPPASEAGKPKGGRRQAPAAQIAPTKPVADATQEDLSPELATDSASESKAQSAAEDSAAEQATGTSNVPTTSSNDHIVTALANDSLNGQAVVSSGDGLSVADTSEPSSTPSQDRPQDNSQNNDPQSTKLDADASASSQGIDPTATSAADKSPSAVAPAAQLPLSDSPQTTAGSTPTNALSNAASAPRSRLPADVLTGPTNAPHRRANVEVDATRLLTRVARAFTAAQERDGEIRLRLSPPELGSLRLDVRVQDGVLVARLQTETDAARTAILDNLPALRDRLSEQGVRIERFDVDLMQRQPGGMPDQPGGRQQDAPTAPVRLVSPPPRSRAEAAASPASSTTTVGPAGGLNVIV